MHKKLNPFRILRYAVLVFMTFITLDVYKRQPQWTGERMI